MRKDRILQRLPMHLERSIAIECHTLLTARLTHGLRPGLRIAAPVMATLNSGEWASPRTMQFIANFKRRFAPKWNVFTIFFTRPSPATHSVVLEITFG